jgi:LPS-assembly lipoprotein
MPAVPADRPFGAPDRGVFPWRAALTVVLGLLALAPAISGCGFQPLYGSSASGEGVAAGLASVDIALIPGRVGQVVRNELVFLQTGGRAPLPPKYRLVVALRESSQPLLANDQGKTRSSIVGLDADFKLYTSGENKLLLTATANGRAAYQSVDSAFANTRASRDAEDRAARIVAQSIRSQVAAYIAQGA